MGARNDRAFVARLRALGRVIAYSVAELVLSLRDRELGRFPITSVDTTIGRDAGSQVVIDNAGVSRLHARLLVEAGRFFVVDCDSENGISVNGKTCRRAELADGDVIGINKFLLRLSNPDNAAAENLASQAPRGPGRPKDIQQTVHLESGAVEAFAEQARQMIERQRAEMATLARSSHEPAAEPVRAPRPQLAEIASPRARRPSAALFIGGMVIGGAVVAAALLLLAL